MTNKSKASPQPKRVGKVSPEERDQIREIYERKNSLAELFRTLTDVDKEETSRLYEKLVKDMADTSARYQRWFDVNGGKYQWENVQGGHWQVNFDTCEVFLVK
jgi:CXXX repeat modification system protein